MKKINLVVVGKLKEKFYQDAAAEYIKRLSRFCDLKITQIDDYADDGIKKESDILIASLNKFWLLDIGGQKLTSEAFAHTLNDEFLSGTVTFVIGGSDGVDERVRKAAAKRISFGAFTYPHQLMRVMLLEQIYRAMTITANLPYHK